MTTAKKKIPLGQVEDQQLEFKSAAVLDNPEKIAREVVAMLNAQGGEVWIGLREEDGRAMEIEPISEADSRKERLHDHLVDTLEPAPTGDEVTIEIVPLTKADKSEHLLRIYAEPKPNRRPYAYLRTGAWNFPIRVGARLRPMSRDEVKQGFSGSYVDNPDTTATAEERLIDLRQQALAEGLEGLWLAVAPLSPLDLQVQASLFEEIATDPRASGNRKTGWNFARTVDYPQLSTHAIRWGGGYGPEHAGRPSVEVQVEITETGEAHFYASFGALARKGHDIWPFTLLEYPVSAFRMLKRIFTEQTDTSFNLLADLALLGLKDRQLAAGSPGDFSFDLRDAQSFEDGDDLVLASPLAFERREIVKEPDRCAFRLLRKIYQGFGYREDAIPREFSRASGRLIFPE